ncbi:hypothetical protein [Chlamydiifrater phoenicopteri]|uniref:hypothetical protein n=1 Tax=Chlamydiifrater phoenicopteri TaxID=2681469 RepID=UPI001BCF52FC|nr:hypothetical protein [Chlamydiifrater phoenicopteri]
MGKSKANKTKKNSVKKASKNTKKTAVKKDLYPQQLEAIVSSIYSELPALQSITLENSEKELNKLMTTLTRSLSSLPVEELAEDLFDQPDASENFSKQLNSVLSEIKKLSSSLQKEI